MKKIFLVIIFCFVALNLSYAQGTISSSQAKDFVGELKSVKEHVAEISTASKNRITYLNFELKHPDNNFKDNKDAFGFTSFNKCTNIIIYGKIELYKEY